MGFELSHTDQSNKLQDFPVTELVLAGKTVRAKVDTADLRKILSVSTHWHARWDEDSKTYYVYATHAKIALHRLIADAPRHLTVDHWDHDGLNNRRSNCRIVSQAINSINRRMRLGVTGFRGVTRRGKKFRASVLVNRKRIVLGDWPTPELAAEAVTKFRRGAL